MHSKDADRLEENLDKTQALECNSQELAYFTNCLNPLLLSLNQLSSISTNLAASVSALSVSIIEPAKRSKLDDTIELIYDINDKCEDIYKVLRKRINIFLEITQKD